MIAPQNVPRRQGDGEDGMSMPENEEKQPWYHRPLLGNFPGWIIFCLAMSAAVAYLGHAATNDLHRPESGVRGAIIGAVVGLPIGVFFLNLIQMKQRRVGAKELPHHLLPPSWLGAIVWVAGFVFLGIIMVKREQFFGLLIILATSVAGIGQIRHEPRGFLTYASGVICLLLTTAGLLLAVLLSSGMIAANIP